jgi:hypothetical protein
MLQTKYAVSKRDEDETPDEMDSSGELEQGSLDY